MYMIGLNCVIQRARIAILAAVTLAAALVGAVSSFAADDIKFWTVDMTTPIRNEDGSHAKDLWDPSRTSRVSIISEGPRKGELVDDDPLCSKCRELSLGHLIEHALKATAPDGDKDVSWEQRWAWSVYADQIKNEMAARIDSLHSELIIKRLGKIGISGAVLNQAIPLIDPNRKVPEIKAY